MPHSEQGGPLAKRQKLSASSKPNSQGQQSRIFAPYRTIGLVSPTNVPFTTVPLGKTTFQLTTSVGRSLQTYDLRRGLNLVFITRPQTPFDITATCAWRQKVFAAFGDPRNGEGQGIWVFQRGKRLAELELPLDLQEPIKQVLVSGSWIIASCLTRIEVWKTETLEHYTTLFTMAANKGDNEITGGISTMPTYLNKIFAGRRDGWVELWNVSTGKLIYTILPPSPDCGAVTCLQPSPALSLMGIAYSNGPVIIQNILTDKTVLNVNAGTEDAPVTAITFRTDGQGAGHDGRKDGVMATATSSSGDITFWDLNKGGRVMGVLRSAHNPPSRDGPTICGGVSKIEFLAGQPVIVTSGRDNSLKSWIFDETPFSPIPRILHSRSGHAAPVTSLQFLPSDFDGADAGNKWLLSAGQDRSLWGWSLRRDGQSTEISQGNIRKKAKKFGILANDVLKNGPTKSLDDLKAPEITCIACSLNRDGGMGAIPGKQAMWQKSQDRKNKPSDAELSGMTGWESVVTAHKNDPYARTWFWGRKRAGRWAFPTTDKTDVSTVAISPCGTFAVLGSVGGGIDMYNLQSGLHRQKYPSTLTPAQARQARLQQLKQADSIMQLEARSATGFGPGVGRHTKAVTGIVVDSMNKQIISCSLDGKIKFWEFLTGRLAHEISWAPMTAITGCRYHAANDLVAFSCDDHSIRVVDIETKQTIREFWGCQGKINDFVFSNDGRWMIAASQDAIIRVWDLPTSHLIDAIRLEQPCTALAFSVTGEYLAAAAEGQLGVNVWTNKTLFTHVPTRQISEREIGHVSGPTTSGEGGQGLIDAAFEEEAPGDEDSVAAPLIDQLSTDMMTLSLVPRSRWQTLLHLDLIKKRNKPKEAPKLPEKAPFFLPSTTNSSGPKVDEVKTTDSETQGHSRITKFDRSTRSEEAFTSKLRAGAEGGDYNELIEYLKSLSPSSADLELRSLSTSDTDDESNELLHFIQALTSRLKSRKDYELTQAWMTVFLRLHFDVILESDTLMAALQDWKKHQAGECDRLDNLKLPGMGKMEAKGDDEIMAASSTEASRAASTRPATEVDHSDHNDDDQTRIDVEDGTALQRTKTHFGDRPACFKNTFQEVSFVFQATVATATASFLTGVGMIVTASIGRDLGMTQSEISWITASTSLVAGAFQLALGQLADLLGRKVMFVVGMGSFSAFVLLLAFAQNPFWMVILCGVLGLPCAMVVPPAIGILGAAYKTPSKRKNLAFSAFSAGNPLGFVFGLIVCGIASSISSWRAAYVFLCILWAVFTVHAVWAVPNVENFDRAPFRERVKALKHFDYVGTVLTIFGTGMFTAGLTLGPDNGWSSATVIALLVVGVILLVVFVLWERVYPNPLMPPYIWKDRNFSLVIITILLGMMGFTASGFWIAFYMQSVQQLPTITVAVHLLPMAIAGLTWNVVAGHILHKVNNTLIMIGGSLCFLAASLLLAFMKSDSSYWAFIFPALILNVAGADFNFNVANMYVMSSLPSHQQSLAGGIFNVVIRLSSTAVMGITTAVFSSVELTPEGMADPMLKYTRTFQACVALAAASVLFSPFIKLGTQGNAPKHPVESEKPELVVDNSKKNVAQEREKEFS
ncbi:WD domain-containing protein [Seiridium cupressi]